MDVLSVIILAAGKGTRMESDLPKVLHKVAGKTMVDHVIGCARQLTPDHYIHVVVGHQAQRVQREIISQFNVNFCFQNQLIGTGDAVKCALPCLSEETRDVLVLYGDVPLIQPDTLADLLSVHRASKASVTILVTELENPTGYGRIIQDQNQQIIAIREEADASDDEKKNQRINTGIYCFDRHFLTQALNRLRPDNSQSEYYLTDVIDIACKKNEKISVKIMGGDPWQVLGINTLAELDRAQSCLMAGE